MSGAAVAEQPKLASKFSMLRRKSSVQDLQATPCLSDSDSGSNNSSATNVSTKTPKNNIEVLRYEGLESRCDDPKQISDYLRVVRTIGGLPWVITSDLMSNMVAQSDKRRTFRDTALDSLMGHCYRSSTLRELRILTGVRSLKQELSGFMYKYGGYTRKLKHFNKEFRSESNDFVARWVHEAPDRTPEDPVLVYFHGGGYALKTCQPQVQYICELARVLRKHRVSVLVLDYTITPFACYPTQRNQAVACVNALQNSCSKVIMLGDSCGGNLALSVLLEEEGPHALDFSKIFGCVLISPWVDPGAQDGSMNSKRDILSKKRLNEMTENFVTPEQLADPKVSPIRADAETWKRVLPKNTCVIWGEWECLADQVVEFQKLANIPNYFVERNGSHDCILRGLSPEPCRYITEQLLLWVDAKSNH